MVPALAKLFVFPIYYVVSLVTIFIVGWSALCVFRPTCTEGSKTSTMNALRQNSATPPNDLPTYRLLTGADDATFCRRVSEALAMGYLLYGSPAATFNGNEVIVAQALIWPSVRLLAATSRAKTGPVTRKRKRAR
jgi:hypothetical protein